MKKLLACLLIAALALTSLCGLALAEDEKTTLRVLWWGSQARHDKTMAMIELFEQKNPDIKVEPEFTDWGGYWSKLATQVAGGLTPDVIQMDYAYVSQYANSGVLADLTPYFESKAIDISDVADSVMKAGQVGEGVYALSTGSNACVIGYRKDIADEAGVTVPVSPTWEELEEISKTVYEKTGRKNTQLSGASFGESLRFYLRSYGLQAFSADGKALGFDDPKYIVMVWERIMRAVEEGYGMAPGEETAAGTFDVFAADSWMRSFYNNQMGAMEENSGCTLTLVELPRPADSTEYPTYFKPTMFWSIGEKSEVKDAAAKFINFFVNDTDCADIAGTDRGLPISSKIRDHIAPTLSAADQRVVEFMNYLSESGHTTPIMPPDPAAYGEVEKLFNEYTEQVRYGLVSDLEATAREFITEANGILAAKAAE